VLLVISLIAFCVCTFAGFHCCQSKKNALIFRESHLSLIKTFLFWHGQKKIYCPFIFSVCEILTMNCRHFGSDFQKDAITKISILCLQQNAKLEWFLCNSTSNIMSSLNVMYEDAFNRSIDEIKILAAYQCWQGLIYSILYIFVYPLSW
jgi:hypothetical protein